ncbi:unnamed protein product [Discula destructiva]
MTTSGSNGRGAVPNEQTPLINGSATVPPYTERHERQDDEETEPDIDPDDFDVLLSKSTSYNGGPLLGPESSETPLLRGERKYSSSASRRPALGRRPSSSSQLTAAIDNDLAGELERARSAAESPFLNGLSRSHFWLIFSNVLALNFISNFDSTLMASSHPVITSYFNSSNSASWLSTAFLLTSTAFQPLLGSLSDSLGRKTPYICTMAIFALATLWCALAQSMTSFIVARAVCGIGAGGVMTLGSIIVSDLVPIERRGAYQSYINMIYGVGSTLGAALGGFMADYLGWRWEFGIQVPPLLLCVGISTLIIPNNLGLGSKKQQTVFQALKSFDFKGAFCLVCAITFLILGLNLGGNVLPWSHPFVITSLVIFSVSFPTFIWVESFATKPIMPLYLIRTSPHANLIFGNALAAFVMNAIIFNMPLFLQAVLLKSATTSGFCLMIITVMSSMAGTSTGFLINWTKRLKWPVGLGATGMLVGAVALSLMQRGWPLWAYLLCLVPHSMGQGFQFPGTFMAVLAVSEQKEQAVVTSTLILWRSIGMVLGIAGSSLVVQNSLWGFLEMYVTDEAARAGGFAGGQEEVVAKVRESVEAVATLTGAVQEQVIVSYDAAIRTAFMLVVLLAALSVLILAPVKLPRLGSRKK